MMMFRGITATALLHLGRWLLPTTEALTMHPRPADAPEVLFGGAEQEMKMAENKPATATARRRVRIFSINDVYLLDLGMPYVMAEMSTFRRENPDTIVIFSIQGDFLGGGAHVNFDAGATLVEQLLLLGSKADYRLVSVGNHEFDPGLRVLVERLEKLTQDASYPWIFVNNNFGVNLDRAKKYQEDAALLGRPAAASFASVEAFAKLSEPAAFGKKERTGVVWENIPITEGPLAGGRMAAQGMPVQILQPFYPQNNFTMTLLAACYTETGYSQAATAWPFFVAVGGETNKGLFQDKPRAEQHLLFFSELTRQVKKVQNEKNMFQLALTHQSDKDDELFFCSAKNQEAGNCPYGVMGADLALAAHSHETLFLQTAAKILVKTSMDAKELIVCDIELLTEGAWQNDCALKSMFKPKQSETLNLDNVAKIIEDADTREDVVKILRLTDNLMKVMQSSDYALMPAAATRPLLDDLNKRNEAKDPNLCTPSLTTKCPDPVWSYFSSWSKKNERIDQIAFLTLISEWYLRGVQGDKGKKCPFYAQGSEEEKAFQTYPTLLVMHSGFMRGMAPPFADQSIALDQTITRKLLADVFAFDTNFITYFLAVPGGALEDALRLQSDTKFNDGAYLDLDMARVDFRFTPRVATRGKNIGTGKVITGIEKIDGVPFSREKMYNIATTANFAFFHEALNGAKQPVAKWPSVWEAYQQKYGTPQRKVVLMRYFLAPWLQRVARTADFELVKGTHDHSADEKGSLSLPEMENLVYLQWAKGAFSSTTEDEPGVLGGFPSLQSLLTAGGAAESSWSNIFARRRPATVEDAIQEYETYLKQDKEQQNMLRGVLPKVLQVIQSEPYKLETPLKLLAASSVPVRNKHCGYAIKQVRGWQSRRVWQAFFCFQSVFLAALSRNANEESE
ncbi:unnamed protein product [Amoebophrya sp. A120]|nr:unnamed protein product [Amoebophrya sp. A120]|eukprot:GSA120T00011084001.1